MAGGKKLLGTADPHQEVATNHILIEGAVGLPHCFPLQPQEQENNEQEPYTTLDPAAWIWHAAPFSPT
jgi:hypothetical protein